METGEFFLLLSSYHAGEYRCSHEFAACVFPPTPSTKVGSRNKSHLRGWKLPGRLWDPAQLCHSVSSSGASPGAPHMRGAIGTGFAQADLSIQTLPCYICGHYWIWTCSPVAVVLTQAWYCPRVWLWELIFRPLTPHLDGEPQQFTKQTVPVWESTATAASNAMNTINKPCSSFPTVLENWDPMPARDGVSEKIIL